MPALDWIDQLLARERLPERYRASVEDIWGPLTERITLRARTTSGPLLVGICGAQGSGKSTAALVIAELLSQEHLPTVVLSIDDFYLTRAERLTLARQVHPLLATRGVPGTHDVRLALEVLDSLRHGQTPALPRFDKAMDDRVPQSRWLRPRVPPQVVILEGWCVGARPQDPAALVAPINELERQEDPDGRWRRYVNEALAGPYRLLFDPISLLTLLAAPSFEVVLKWRLEQENKLRERLERDETLPGWAMSEEEVARFVAHYERVSRNILQEMPARADVLIRLDAERNAAP